MFVANIAYIDFKNNFHLYNMCQTAILHTQTHKLITKGVRLKK